MLTVLVQSGLVMLAVATVLVIVTGWGESGAHTCGHCDHDFPLGGDE